MRRPLLLFASTTAQSVATLLREAGFEELFPLQTVPVGNARQVRYEVEVTARRDSSRWSVRSYGTGFDLVRPSRRGPAGRWGRWYSLGWGMDGTRPVDELLLVQADAVTEAEAERLVAPLLPLFAPHRHALRWIPSTGTGRTGQALRLAAVLDAASGARC
jgi:hypothetical protein